ncbi:hypothetical protein GDO78_014872 [Eleutherodactylus coqui]|uniref:Uncharacterized protein n=1 Tax=Eleutherodactylus coqui TaxID=57060 RepID=A0A8J6E6U5_ELECQ|nr:hypothetical protein GDO78_014872 [Eleutherodactylus coqui]
MNHQHRCALIQDILISYIQITSAQMPWTRHNLTSRCKKYIIAGGRGGISARITEKLGIRSNSEHSPTYMHDPRSMEMSSSYSMSANGIRPIHVLYRTMVH